MNFYKHHLGDYAQATAHLSFVEDAAYSRLLRKYYAEEKPIPGDLKAAQRLVAARTREEKDAVQTVLEEFFQFDASANVWRNKRADEEIEVARDAEDAGQDKKENEKERQRRHRERRKSLFAQLRELDIIPKWDTATDKLESMLSRVTGAARNGDSNVTERVTGATGHAPATANQTPDSIEHQDQEQKTAPHARSPQDSPAPAPTATDAGRACRLMRDAGCSQTNPSHVDLLAALAEGVSPETLASTAAEAIEAGKGKPFAWAISTARSRHAEGPRAITTGPPQRAAPIGKTVQALQTLEAMKHGPDVDQERDFDGLPEAHHARIGAPARR